MQDYYKLLEYILENGRGSDDRTGTGTISSFGHQMRFDISESFPLLTGKHTSFKMIATELLWFLKGNPNIDFLHENDCHIWDEWVKEDGTFGPIYGKQWRSWNRNYPNMQAQELTGGTTDFKNGSSIDQIKNVIHRLKTDPVSRRHIVSAWNVADVELGEMALPPCHLLFQFNARRLSDQERINLANVNEDWRKLNFNDFDGVVPAYSLSCQMYQRSADMFLGVPYNIASYSMLTYMIAHLTNMVPGEFIHTIGDAHIYKNHIDQVKELLGRDVSNYPLPRLEINRKIDSIDDFTLNDFEVIGYKAMSAIKAPIAI